jgi:hypothetical protein
MPIKMGDLVLYGSAVMPDSDTPTAVGGAIDTAKKAVFKDLAGLVQVVAAVVGEGQNMTVHGRNSGGALVNETVVISGQTPVTFATTWERLMKALLGAPAASGAIGVENQTAARSNTAQAGTADTITLDAGASAADQAYRTMVIRLTAGAASGEIGEAIDYVGATKVLTERGIGATPDGTTVFRLAEGFFFDFSPVKVTEVRRVFYDAAADSPGGSPKTYFEKVFFKNTSGLTLTDAVVKEASDPSGNITFGVAAAINDSGTNGGGNNRQVAPAGITFDNADKAVPGGSLGPGDSIGIWLKLSLLAGAAALNTTYGLKLQGSTI